MADLCNYSEITNHYEDMRRQVRAVVSGSPVVADYLDALFIKLMHESIVSGVSAQLINERAFAVQIIKADFYANERGTHDDIDDK